MQDAGDVCAVFEGRVFERRGRGGKATVAEEVCVRDIAAAAGGIIEVGIDGDVVAHFGEAGWCSDRVMYCEARLKEYKPGQLRMVLFSP